MRIHVVGYLLALLVLAMPTGVALAQSEPVVLSGSGVEVMTTSMAQERVLQLEEDYKRVRLAGPRAGVGTSAIFVAGGIVMMMGGAAVVNLDRNFCLFETAPCGKASAAGPALLVSGVVAIAGGMTGVVLMTRKLKQKKKEQRKIQREINTLKRSLPPESG